MTHARARHFLFGLEQLLICNAEMQQQTCCNVQLFLLQHSLLQQNSKYVLFNMMWYSAPQWCISPLPPTAQMQPNCCTSMMHQDKFTHSIAYNAWHHEFPYLAFGSYRFCDAASFRSFKLHHVSCNNPIQACLSWCCNVWCNSLSSRLSIYTRIYCTLLGESGMFLGHSGQYLHIYLFSSITWQLNSCTHDIHKIHGNPTGLLFLRCQVQYPGADVATFTTSLLHSPSRCWQWLVATPYCSIFHLC